MSIPSPLRVTLLGCGVVGSQVARGLLSHHSDLAARVGAPVVLDRIVVRDPDEVTDPDIPRHILTSHAQEAIEGADIVVELFGGIEPARSLILQAIAGGASVVTANKALLAEHGPQLYEAADAAGVDLYFEAAVGGAIPIVGPMRDSLAGDHVQRILGIVNGTTNYVLDQMTSTGMSLEDAVAQAQELGYAEADPTADVDGFDAASKAAILASLAFHTRVSVSDVAREGIRGITADDVAWASKTGHVVKLLAIVEATGGGVSARVHPALVPVDHPLAAVHGAFNAVFVQAAAAGPLMFYGQGAGGLATSSAVLGDVVKAARHRVQGTHAAVESAQVSLPLLGADAIITKFQVRMSIEDKPGVLARVAGVFSEYQVSIETVQQTVAPDQKLGGALPPAGAGSSVNCTCNCGGGQGMAYLMVTTHEASELAMASIVEVLTACEFVHSIVSILRIEGN